MKKLYHILVGFFVCTATTSQHAMEVVIEQSTSKNALSQSNGLRSSLISMHRLMNWNECREDETMQQTEPVVPQASSTSSTGTATAQSVQSQPSNPTASCIQDTQLFWQALQPQSEDLTSALILLSIGAQPNLKTISAEESNNKIYPLVVYLIKHAHKENKYNPVDLLKKFIALGLNVNVHPNKEISLLNHALNRSVKYTQNITIKAIIKELLAAGADITTLVQSKDKQTFEILLACEADATKMFNIFAAIQTERPLNLFELLLKAGASVIEFVKQNNVDSMRWLIEHHAQLNHPSNILLLHTATASNQYKMVDLLLANKINLTYADPNSQDATAIQIPLFSGRVGMVEKLLKAGVPPYKKGSPEEQLMLAVEKNDTNAAIALLEGSPSQRKANPNLITHKGQHILIIALENKNREMAGTLMQHDCKLNYIITQGNVSAINALLKIKQEQPINLTKQAIELLELAMERHKSHWLEMVETLLQYTAFPEAIAYQYESVHEFLQNDPSSLKKLITLLTEYVKKNRNGISPMHIAATLDSPKLLFTLTTMFPQLCKSKDKDGNTPLHYAAQRNSVTTANTDEEADQQRVELAKATEQTIEILVKTGAEINAQNDNDETPLLLAARYNNVIAIKTLVALGAKSAITNKQHISPLTIAALYGEEDAIKALEAETKSNTNTCNSCCIISHAQ